MSKTRKSISKTKSASKHKTTRRTWGQYIKEKLTLKNAAMLLIQGWALKVFYGYAKFTFDTDFRYNVFNPLKDMRDIFYHARLAYENVPKITTHTIRSYMGKPDYTYDKYDYPRINHISEGTFLTLNTLFKYYGLVLVLSGLYYMFKTMLTKDDKKNEVKINEAFTEEINAIESNRPGMTLMFANVILGMILEEPEVKQQLKMINIKANKRAYLLLMMNERINSLSGGTAMEYLDVIDKALDVADKAGVF